MRVFLTIVFIFLLQHIYAIEYKYGNTVTISSPVYDDLYVTGGTVIIDAPVYGDLIVAAGTVHINDSVMNDILLMGGSVIIRGFIGDDIRCAGGTIYIGGKVVGDLLATGGSIHIQKNGSVASFFSAGGEVTIDGIIRGRALSRSGNVIMNGTILGDTDFRGDKIEINGNIRGKAILAATSNIVIGRSARFERSIHYWLPLQKKLKLKPGVADELPVYDTLLSITHSKWYLLGASTFLGLLWYLSMTYLMIMIIQYFFSSTLVKAGRTFHTNPVRSAFLGIGYFIAIPVAIVFFIVTVIGVPVSVLLAIIYLILLVLATIICSLVIVNWIANLGNQTWSYWRITGTALFTFILLKIIAFTPFFGWLIMMIIIFMSFGAILSNIKPRLLKKAG